MPREPRRTAGPGQQCERELQERATASVANTVRAGAKRYDREHDLPGLVRLEPIGCGNETVAEMEAIVRRLERALRAERNRARSGHWTYDLNRHIALRQAHLAESTRLAARLKPHGRQAESAS